MDAYSPFPIEGLAEEVGFHHTRLPLVVLLGGITGALTGFGLQAFSFMVDYPVNVGGRPSARARYAVHRSDSNGRIDSPSAAM